MCTTKIKILYTHMYTHTYIHAYICTHKPQVKIKNRKTDRHKDSSQEDNIHACIESENSESESHSLQDRRFRAHAQDSESELQNLGERRLLHLQASARGSSPRGVNGICSSKAGAHRSELGEMEFRYVFVCVWF